MHLQVIGFCEDLFLAVVSKCPDVRGMAWSCLRAVSVTTRCATTSDGQKSTSWCFIGLAAAAGPEIVWKVRPKPDLQNGENHREVGCGYRNECLSCAPGGCQLSAVDRVLKKITFCCR
jgi:hypothetical protein